MSNVGKDFNEFYKIHTPIPTPLPFGGFIRLCAKAECVKCGKSFIQVLRVHKVELPSIHSFGRAPIEKPDPNEEKIMTSFMLKACDNGIGCFKTCRPWTHRKDCQMPSRRLILRHDPHTCPCPPSKACTCEIGCGNQGIYPCVCGWVKKHHKDQCPVGLYKRTSSFSVDFMRSQMTAPRGHA